MTEKNKNNLQNSLQNLRSYEPSDRLWAGIESGMDAAAGRVQLQSALHDLPTYEPKEKVWDSIAAELPAEGAKTGRVVSMRVRRWAAAAAIGLLLISTYFLANTVTETGENLAYDTEVVDDQLLAQNWDEDEADFDAVIEMSKAKPFIDAQPEVQYLRAELEELNDARTMLKEALGAYGTNVDLINQLKEIELERAKLLKEMGELV